MNHIVDRPRWYSLDLLTDNKWSIVKNCIRLLEMEGLMQINGARLMKAVEARDMRTALEIAERCCDSIISLSVQNRNTPEILDCVARVIDLRATKYLPVAEKLLKKFTTERMESLNVISMARVELASAIVQLHKEDFRKSIEHSLLAAGLADRCQNTGLRSFARYVLARGYVSTGKYTEVRRVIEEVRKISRGRGSNWALIRMVEGAELFTKGDLDDAEQALKFVTAKLTKDEVVQGNCLFLRARIARREGRFDEAVRWFTEAIAKYEAVEDGSHPNSVHCYAHKAFALFHWAHELAETPTRQQSREETSARIAELQREADKCLEQAEDIYKRQGRTQHSRGMGRVHWFRAVVNLERENNGKAKKEAKMAYSIAEETDDSTVMVHALITEGKCSKEPSIEEAKKAADLADSTDNRRLKLRAKVWLATALLRGQMKNVGGAKKLYSSAIAEINETDRDYLRWELEELNQELDAATAEEARILDVTSSFVHDHGLDGTLEAVQRAIIAKISDANGNNVYQTAKVLKTTRNRVKRVQRLAKQPEPIATQQGLPLKKKRKPKR